MSEEQASAVEALLPCPFCGDDGQPHQDNGHGAILCSVCGCDGPRGFHQDAIDLWNNRPALTAAQSRIEELETERSLNDAVHAGSIAELEGQFNDMCRLVDYDTEVFERRNEREKELREALEPFAAAADNVNESSSYSDLREFVKLGDFRRARTALNEGSKS